MAKARVVVGDQNSAEFDALKRSFNSLLVVLEQIAKEAGVAGTTTAAQAFEGLYQAILTGKDVDVAPHVGTTRLVHGVKSSPTVPKRKAEALETLVTMLAADKF